MTTIPAWADVNDDTRNYYHQEWGQKPSSDQQVFETLSLLTFQAGLTWWTVLSKRDQLRAVFHNFDIDKVAAMDAADIERLVTSDSPIKNERKIRAVINNARAIQRYRMRGGEVEPSAMVRLLENSSGLPGDTWPGTGQEQLSLLLHVFAEWEFQFTGPKVCRSLVESLGFALPWAEKP